MIIDRLERLLLPSCYVAIAIAPISGAANAQDYIGHIDPSEWSRPMVMHSTIDAQANSQRARNARPTRQRTTDAEARQTCANIPRVKKRLGARDPRVIDLERLCRMAGYY